MPNLPPISSVPYIVMELPMNLLMKRLGANITLPVMVTLWGIVCACQGAVKTYGGLLACRFFLGALEGVHYLSQSYGDMTVNSLLLVQAVCSQELCSTCLRSINAMRCNSASP
jgi:hypothetical protein